MRFHERAESYDAHAAPQKRFAEALAAFAPFRRGVRVTELGAGTGFLTAALLAQGVNVDATDGSPAMVELGRQAVPAANWSVHNAFGPIEKAGAPAKTVAIWYDHDMKNNEGTKWLRDIRQWWRVSGRTMSFPADGVSGATRAPGDQKIAFTGDAIFKGSVGRTDLPNGDWNQLLTSIRKRIYTLPDDVVLLPGHGGQTSVGVEKQTNPYAKP